ncbi:MAG: Ig-like domain-containing protein [Desulfitobacterium sp.]
MNKETFKNQKFSIGLGLVILLLVGIFWGVSQSQNTPENVQAAEVAFKALNSDKLGVDLDSAFLLTSKEPLNEKSIEKALRTKPEFTYSLAEQAGGLSYKIIPKEPLLANTVYTLSFDPQGLSQENLSWAFQTKGQFRVLSSLPRNESTHIPISTGIEIAFSYENFDIDRVKEHFSISPKVEGTFERHKKTLVFVPETLQPSTLYTVTVKKGFTLPETTQTLQEDYVFSFETEPAKQTDPSFRYDLDTELTEFSTSDIPAFTAYFNNKAYKSDGTTSPVPPLHIDLYRYPDHQAFRVSLTKRDQIPRWSYFTWNGYREELDPQLKVAGYDTKFLQVNDYVNYIVFPKELEAGYYAAEFQAGDATRQVWFQVTDLAVYLAQGEGSTLFWANDLQSKAPAANAEVIIESKQFSETADDSGTVLIQQNLTGKDRDYALVKSESKEVLVPLESWPQWYSENSQAMDYWKYLYLDRELYQPDDVVHFWGVLAPRGKTDTQGRSIDQVKEITLELIGGDYPYYNEAEVSPILRQAILIEDKTYRGELKLPVLKPGYYTLQLKLDDTILLSRGLEVKSYQKPAYQLSVTQDKKAIFAGETMNFAARSTFFEGTPVPDLSLKYYIQGRDNSVITDEQGEAKISYTPTVDKEAYNSYDYVSLGVNALLPETGEIYNSAELYVFRSKVYLTGEARRQEGGYTLSAKLSTVDLTDINNGEYITEENFLKEPVAQHPLKASLYQEIWTPVESGQRYDFISKEVVKTYYYDYSTKHLGDLDLMTDAAGQISYTGGSLERQNSYYLELVAEDKEGRPFKKRLLIGQDNGNPKYQYYYLLDDAKKEGYKPGEQVQVTFRVNDGDLTPTEGDILYFSGQKMIEHYEVSREPHHRFLFKQEHIPNINVAGVYFDGYNYHETDLLSIPFAKETKALQVKIETNQAVYRPGGKVELNLQVTDTNQQPVKGAQVNLNLVDEALFSLRQQKADFLANLYGDRINLSLLTKKTHFHPGFDGGAEQGGEGGSERKDFRDTVLFTTLQTDDNGRAKIEFQLPDNLTSWRVTYHAFTQDLQAVSGTAQIPVRLPFFVEMNLNKTYLEGDSPVILLRAYGDQLKNNQKVDYEMKLATKEGQEETWQGSADSYTALDWQLPALKKGQYTLTVAAENGGLQDVLTKEFHVAESYQARTITSHELLKEGLVVKGSQQEPTTVVFSDHEKSQYLRGLYQLAWNNGSRLEQKLAALEARKLFKEYFPEEKLYEGEGEEPLLNYQQGDGGICILPYGESELALSAMVASSISGIFDERALKGYFYRMLEGEEEVDQSLVLLGLAALNEPVLLQIEDYLQQKNLAPEARINLALALLEIGDGAFAEKVVHELLGLYGQDLGSSTRINVGRDQDEIIQATTQMALLAARLNQPEKNKLYQYLLENQGKEILNLVEQIQILKYNLKYMETSPVSFTYELSGEKITKSLQGGEIFKLILLPEDLKQIKFSQVNGQVGIVCTYNQPIRAGETGDGSDLSISRSYLVNGSERTSVNSSDLVQIVIDVNIGDKAPGGIYEVIDILPAGLAHISRPYAYQSNNNSQWDFPVEVNGQKLVFQLGKGQKQIKYLARVTSPGEFNCEAPVLSNIMNNEIYTCGAEGKLIISSD